MAEPPPKKRRQSHVRASHLDHSIVSLDRPSSSATHTSASVHNEITVEEHAALMDALNSVKGDQRVVTSQSNETINQLWQDVKTLNERIELIGKAHEKNLQTEAARWNQLHEARETTLREQLDSKDRDMQHQRQTHKEAMEGHRRVCEEDMKAQRRSWEVEMHARLQGKHVATETRMQPKDDSYHAYPEATRAQDHVRDEDMGAQLQQLPRQTSQHIGPSSPYPPEQDLVKVDLPFPTQCLFDADEDGREVLGPIGVLPDGARGLRQEIVDQAKEKKSTGWLSFLQGKRGKRTMNDLMNTKSV